MLTAHVALVSETDAVQLDDLSTVSAAMQKQVTRDFGPIWNVDATVDAFDSLDSVPVDYWPVIVADDINQPGAAGFHTDDHGQPFALVQVDDNWPLTVSHETLEMLADPFGNRTIAGLPPDGAPDPIGSLDRVTYLVEVSDPCEDAQFSYNSNGIAVSDFITPNYYDPTASGGVRYSFTGSITAPHTVLEGGYVSFGNPVDNNWYQILVQNGEVTLRDLGVITSTNGKSLRELVDFKVRKAREKERYRLKPLRKAAAAGVASPFAATTKARAKHLREFVKRLK
jgi:hypothetical protein